MEIEAFKAKFLPIHPKLYRIAYALVNQKEEAEDLLQETYIRLWNKRDELEAVNSPEAFAVATIKNLCIDYLRSTHANQGDNENLEQIRIESDDSPDRQLENREQIRYVRHLINQLPEKQREVIRLRGIQDCSFDEIEKITGLSSTNIRTLLSRARKAIREKLIKWDEQRQEI